MASDYPQTLVEQARALLSLDATGRPRQANLRRAVSSAYYGLFHRLCLDAAAEFVGAAPMSRGAGRFLVRKFEHGRMRSTCQDFAGRGGRPRAAVLQTAVAAAPLDPRLAAVCDAFVELQDERHRADYDLSRRFIRPDAAASVALAESALGDWAAVKTTEQARLFKLCLLVGTSAR